MRRHRAQPRDQSRDSRRSSRLARSFSACGRYDAEHSAATPSTLRSNGSSRPSCMPLLAPSTMAHTSRVSSCIAVRVAPPLLAAPAAAMMRFFSAETFRREQAPAGPFTGRKWWLSRLIPSASLATLHMSLPYWSSKPEKPRLRLARASSYNAAAGFSASCVPCCVRWRGSSRTFSRRRKLRSAQLCWFVVLAESLSHAPRGMFCWVQPGYTVLHST